MTPDSRINTPVTPSLTPPLTKLLVYSLSVQDLNMYTNKFCQELRSEYRLYARKY